MATSPTELSVPEKVRLHELDDDPELLQHVKRPQWGLAILAWERGERRAYQFEDGRLRTFKRGYYDLMQPGESRGRPEDAVITDLQDAIGTARSIQRTCLEPVATFEQQIDLFTTLYPAGFADEKWVAEHRGSADGRRLKRHREATMADAREILSAGACAAWLGEERYDKMAKAICDLMSGTDLVTLSKVKTLRAMDDDETRRFAEAAAELLHGEGDFSPRFKAWIAVLEQVLAGTPPWRFATVLPALMEPDKQVCVRHSAFIRQAALIAPTARYSRSPKARSYRNFRRVARMTRTRLEAAGHEPRDLMDVHDFMWTTLRDSALEHLGEG